MRRKIGSKLFLVTFSNRNNFSMKDFQIYKISSEIILVNCGEFWGILFMELWLFSAAIKTTAKQVLSKKKIYWSAILANLEAPV